MASISSVVTSYSKRSVKEMHANQGWYDDEDDMNNVKSVKCILFHCTTLEYALVDPLMQRLCRITHQL
jgi:hypothetical protein